ncbi:MAG TPA: ADP-glyceromanno-heptose 6-epimerase [Chitinophagales bacterium]|nr:ADP-glyceromanno-heptose 6-epimerase [Chitinophagales bacterium]
MKKTVITGAAGFIGSNLARKLSGSTPLVLVDKFNNEVKNHNLEGIAYEEKIDRDDFVKWLEVNGNEIKIVYHLGARTDTTEFNMQVLNALNLDYSKAVWRVCTEKQIPLIYASSAATYGAGEHGFNDSHNLIKELKPLNPYGLSKQLFDLFVLEQKQTPPFWAGLKFFNVYGPYEFHKGRMASVVFHAYRQIKETGQVKLFKSHRDDYPDGGQLRDFVFVDDVVNVCLFFGQMANESGVQRPGIYNVGSGKARTFNDLVRPVFNTLGLPVNIEYVSIPQDIRGTYQYFTEATMDKLLRAGYTQNFTSIEKGVEKYTLFLEKH